MSESSSSIIPMTSTEPHVKTKTKKDPNHTFSKGKAFCFTWNNYPENYKAHLETHSCKIKYLVCGEEISKTGTPHLQGFVRWIATTTDMATSKKLGNAHVEIANGTDKQNDAYCRGIGKTAEEHGKIPHPECKIFTIGRLEETGQGRRLDIKKIKKDAISGKTLREVLNDCDTIHDINMVEKVYKYHEPKRTYTTDFEFIWIYGPTEMGKTKYVISELYKTEYDAGEVYMCMDSAQWWDGYDGQRIIILDDFRCSFCPLNVLLKICQPIEMRVQVKGSSRQLQAKTVVITTCHSPIETYQGVTENRNQLYRRITKLLRFSEFGKFIDETEILKKYVEFLKTREHTDNNDADLLTSIKKADIFYENLESSQFNKEIEYSIIDPEMIEEEPSIKISPILPIQQEKNKSQLKQEMPQQRLMTDRPLQRVKLPESLFEPVSLLTPKSTKTPTMHDEEENTKHAKNKTIIIKTKNRSILHENNNEFSSSSSSSKSNNNPNSSFEDSLKLEKTPVLEEIDGKKIYRLFKH